MKERNRIGWGLGLLVMTAALSGCHYASFENGVQSYMEEKEMEAEEQQAGKETEAPETLASEDGEIVFRTGPEEEIREPDGTIHYKLSHAVLYQTYEEAGIAGEDMDDEELSYYPEYSVFLLMDLTVENIDNTGTNAASGTINLSNIFLLPRDFNTNDIYAEALMPAYFDQHKDGEKNYWYLDANPGTTVTVHLGFLIPKDSEAGDYQLTYAGEALAEIPFAETETETGTAYASGEAAA